MKQSASKKSTPGRLNRSRRKSFNKNQEHHESQFEERVILRNTRQVGEVEVVASQLIKIKSSSKVEQVK